ncbi:DNA translocase FtsK 4TM domain-containing protein [Alphaproteobacteria bacterium]|nr:DNA translocase FtsK 4TM domain-containing protein [Alphaproteobacteria bacterium]
MADPTEKKPFLSPALASFLRRRLMEITGIVLIAIGVLLLMTLLPAYSSDNSLSVFSTRPVQHWLGSYGATVASALYEAVGLAAFAFTILPISWGYRLLRNQEIGHKRVRFFMAPVALVLLAAGFYGAAGVFMDGSIGGSVGPIITGMILPLIPPIPDFYGITTMHLLGTGCLIFGAMAFVWAAAMSRQQWRIITWPLGVVGKGAKLVFGGILSRSQSAAAHDDGAGAGASAKEKKSRRTKKKSGAKSRQEPTLVAGATPLDAAPSSPATAGSKQRRATQASLDFDGGSGFKLPPHKLLKTPGKAASGPSQKVLEERARQLEEVLGDFSINGSIGDVRYGPVVTRYDLNPAPGTKSQRVISLADDIARSMSAISVRVAVVPGQNVIGIELPNEDRQTVMLREILDDPVWTDDNSGLPMALGKDIAGAPVIVDLAQMPHLLVAGTTGSGKSVGINAMILSMLYRHTPETCRMIMIDPKMLELSVYDGIPHLLSPVVTDPSKAVTALKWAVREMENRYRNMAKMGVRNITGYNERLAEARANGEVLTRRVQTGFDQDSGRPVHEEEILDLAPLPFIVVVIDEVADLMLVAGKEIEGAVQRLAQMARAAGIHVVMATQRPSVDVITGTIKANFPTRISFQVTSRIDSRTILGEQGAEQLLGRGDMLFMEGGGRVVRVHGPFVEDGEVEAVANFLRLQGEPEYDERVVADEPEGGEAGGLPLGEGGNGNSLYDQAVQLVVREQKASTSFVQRHLKIGYNRAATIIEEMESAGIISAANHVGKREVLLNNEDGF